MVKPKKPVSQQPEPEQQDTGHPLFGQVRAADELYGKLGAREAGNEKRKAELEEWSRTVKMVASTEAGEQLLRGLVQHSELFSVIGYKDTVKMVDVNRKSEFYLKWVRPFLTPDLRSAIE